MACDPAVQLAAGVKFTCVELQSLVAIIAYQLTLMAGGSTDPNVILKAAALAKFTCPSFQDLMAIIAYQICVNGAGGGAGGTGNQAPGVVNPEGNVTASPGATYFNTANSTFWEKASGAGNTGWIELI